MNESAARRADDPQHARLSAAPEGDAGASERTPQQGSRPHKVQFSAEIARAENQNLRERIARLEASIAYWAADLDGAAEASEGLKQEIRDAQQALRQSEDRRAALLDQRASLVEDVAARDARIEELEAKLSAVEAGPAAARRTRARVVRIWNRLRERLSLQQDEIDGLRRSLSAGHAARKRVEQRLAIALEDAERDARYLDKIEARLARAEGRAHPSD